MRTGTLVVMVTVLLVAGCGGTGEEPTPQGCEPAPAVLLEQIQQGVVEGTGAQLLEGQTYRSPDHSQVWFVAATFSADGVDDQVGVWATNELDGTGALMAASPMAKQFTTWTDAAASSVEIPVTDPGIAAATACLG